MQYLFELLPVFCSGLACSLVYCDFCLLCMMQNKRIEQLSYTNINHHVNRLLLFTEATGVNSKRVEKDEDLVSLVSSRISERPAMEWL